MDDLEAIKQLFINFDADKNGTISNKELQAFIDSISGKVNRGCNRLFGPKFFYSDKLTEAQMLQLINNMQDLDGDGKMDFEEFCLMMTGK